MVWKRLTGTQILETGEFKNYLGHRQGQERTDSDGKAIYGRMGSETFHLLSFNLNSLKHVVNASTC